MEQESKESGNQSVNRMSEPCMMLMRISDDEWIDSERRGLAHVVAHAQHAVELLACLDIARARWLRAERVVPRRVVRVSLRVVCRRSRRIRHLGHGVQL
jgi:hypothetical protein